MNPYPTRAALRHEADADALLAEQAESDAAFRAIVGTALVAIKRLEFPLGCPAPGYDIEDVTGALADWLLPDDPFALSIRAADRAREAGEDDPDYRRDMREAA